MAGNPVVGIQSPGDMGHGVGGVLHQHGLRVISCLEGRSERTRELAREAGIEPVDTFEALVGEADIILSILVPGRAIELAERLGAAIRTTGAEVIVSDWNAISPATVRKVGEIITAAGGQFADGGIIGGPPPNPSTHMYLAGPAANDVAKLGEFGLNVRVLDGPVGQASGLKMCYAAMTKGTQALGLELLVAAKRMGLEQVLRQEQEGSVAPVLNFIARQTPSMGPKAYRWVSEMEEIARTFEELGMTPHIFQGAAAMYDFVADTPIGKETPENRDRSRDMDGVIAALADALDQRESAPVA